MATSEGKRAKRWTDAKLAAFKLPDGIAEQRVLVAPGLYLHGRRKADGTVAKHWQYRAQVDGVCRWLSLGAYPAVGLGKANEEMLAHQKAHEAAKKGEAGHQVIAARFARKAGKPVRQRTIDVLGESFNGDIKDRIGDAKVAKLTREALRACIDAPRKRGTPGAAAHVYRTCAG